MLVGEIALRVKRQFGDEAGAQITDADIIRWVNDAQRSLAASNDLLQATATTPLIRGQDQYFLPPDILTLSSVRIAGRKLSMLTNDQAAEWTPNVSNASQGMPTHYSQWASRLDLYPTPDRSDPDDLQLYYTRNPIAVTGLNDLPELPLQYHNAIVDYCLAQAHELDDNMESYKMKMDQFESGAVKALGIERVAQEVYPSISVSTRDTGAEDYHYYE